VGLVCLHPSPLTSSLPQSQWYNLDEGHDFEEDDPFGMDVKEAEREEAVKKQRMQQNPGRKVSAQRQQLNEDQERWERSRMLTSGAVQRIGPDDDIEDEEEDKVQLLTHHVIPPFLDGRITFTKQPEPVIPVKDPASDIAVLATKGSVLVRREKEKSAAIKGQKKEWNLAGTQIGKIMGIEAPKEEEDLGHGEWLGWCCLSSCLILIPLPQLSQATTTNRIINLLNICKKRVRLLRISLGPKLLNNNANSCLSMLFDRSS